MKNEKSVEYTIRPIKSVDESFLWEMLYQAIYVPQGNPPLPREVLNNPEISKYVKNWGEIHDKGFIAVEQNSQKSIGAVWIRLLIGENKGYGYVDDFTPELTIAILQEYRNKGIGSNLLNHLFTEAQSQYNAICLSVSLQNPALRLYQRLGFEVVKTVTQFHNPSITMIKVLKK
jgi:ribosomal protein S18 acetylase RimI-like enzyme